MDQNGNTGDEGRDQGGDVTSSGGGGFQRRILTEISPQAWEHPADRAALNALRKIPGFDLALRKIFGMFGEWGDPAGVQSQRGARVREAIPVESTNARCACARSWT